MRTATSDYRFGIEEEYFLSDAVDRSVVGHISPRFIAEIRSAYPAEVQREMLQSQIEVATPVCTEMEEARESLMGLRQGLAGIAGEHGLLLMASGTHPSAAWVRQRVTAAARYDRLMRDLQMLGSRNQVCGLHVHVELPDDETRIDVMGRMLPYLPVILALSTSSPFWQGHRTGLMGYRLSAYRELPRTGLPEVFADAADYRRYLDIMISTRAIEDSSFVWWAIRPSREHPTLELRVADSCTRLEDTLAIAALYRCLVRRLHRDRRLNADPSATTRALTAENIWRAQRYGVHAGLVDEASASMKPMAQLVEEVASLVAGDAAALGCEREIAALTDIVSRGTSADAQLAVFEEARTRQRSADAAFSAVVDWLAAETRGGFNAMRLPEVSNVVRLH
jgi:glutamate---cysteine ligase / carboxylate-amine ligase